MHTLLAWTQLFGGKLEIGPPTLAYAKKDVLSLSILMARSCCNMPIEKQIEHAIRKSPYFHGTRLRFETCNGRVVLHGVVSSFFHKQIAQETIRRIDGVSQIENQLVVSDEYDGCAFPAPHLSALAGP